MDELQGERQDPAQESANGLLISSTDVDSLKMLDNPPPITNGMFVLVTCISCIHRMYLV